MFRRINESKIWAKHVSCKSKCKFDGKKNVIQIKNGIMIDADVSVKNIIYVKKIISEIALHVVVKVANIQQVLMIQWLRVIKS